jgi:hypothetical protein
MHLGLSPPFHAQAEALILPQAHRERALLIIPLMIFLFLAVHRHYDLVAEALSTSALSEHQLSNVADVVIVPIADVHRGTLRALKYAKRLSKDVRALSITTSPEMRQRLQERWKRFPHITQGITLIPIEYDFRDIMTPVVDYIEQVNNVEFPDQLTTVVIPAFIPEHKVADILHNQTASRLRARLRGYKDIVIIEVPFHIDSQV